MSIVGDLIEDEPADCIADLAVHVSNLRAQNEELRLQRDRYRKEAEYYRVERHKNSNLDRQTRENDRPEAERMCDTSLTGAGS